VLGKELRCFGSASVGDVTAGCGLCVGQASSGEGWILLTLLRLNMGVDQVGWEMSLRKRAKICQHSIR
jgi:hypothetical protein